MIQQAKLPVEIEAPIRCHVLKIDPWALQALLDVERTHEVRKMDRDYQLGDYICLKPTPAPLTVVPTIWMISHILTHGQFPEGIAEGYGVLSVQRTDDYLFDRLCEAGLINEVLPHE